jgi:hypothetical protein
MRHLPHAIGFNLINGLNLLGGHFLINEDPFLGFRLNAIQFFQSLMEGLAIGPQLIQMKLHPIEVVRFFFTCLASNFNVTLELLLDSL